MKAMKKIATFIVCLCMMVSMIPAVAHAASGELRFSDPTTTVGAYVEVTAKLSADYMVDSADATLTYDTEYLRFVSGEGATENNGTIELTGTGDGSATEISWTLEFQALAEGDTKIEIDTVSAVDTDGDSISVTEGSSTVSIGPGDPSLIETGAVGTGEEVDVDGTVYTIATEISELLIPTGFTLTEVVYNGTTYPAVTQMSSGLTAMYLVNAAEEGDFFTYDSETSTFGPFCQILISAERYIILLPEGSEEPLPDYLQQTTMTIDEKQFVAWQNVQDVEYYVIYALNADGVEGYYQYDTVDGTYQRYVPEVVVVEEESTEPVDIFLDLVKENLLTCILGAALVILILIFILIIVSIKLRHRNLELDDLYDEYGIDGEEEEEPKKEKGRFGKKAKKEIEEDDYEEDDYEEDFEEDDYEEDDYEEDVFATVEFNTPDFSDEEDIDDLDELLNERVQKPAARKPVAKEAKAPKAKPAAKEVRPAQRSSKPAVKPAAPRQASKPAVKPAAPRPAAPTVERPVKRVGHMEMDDTFKMDIVDLD